MDKILDWVHGHKRWLGVVLAAAAGAASYLGEHKLTDAILTVGTLTGVGYLPNGPNPKE